MPLINFYGKYDHLVPPQACELLTGRVGSKDTTDVCLETGHIGIYVSSKCQQEFAPRIAAWLADRDAPDKKSRKKKSTAPKKAKAKTAGKSKSSKRLPKDTQRSG
jgi:polyhydroxyalkanoate synthase